MRKRVYIFTVVFMLLLRFNVFAAPEQVVAVGRAVGIHVQCNGLLVVGFTDNSPARNSGIHRGDVIVQVDGAPISCPDTLRALIQDKKQVTITTRRQEREQSFLVRPETYAGTEMIGANVKSDMSGIGTITFYDSRGNVFGALGHGIADTDSSKLFPLKDGFICDAKVVDVTRGAPGSPGMLQGAFDPDHILGTIQDNTPCGIFGTASGAIKGETVPVAQKGEIQLGHAEIISTVSGYAPAHYQIEITRLYPVDDGTGRNLMFRVTDSDLLSKTGGIVQGMSGSPILQNGKIVGAVTHVLISDPHVGYGIFIENMLDAAS